jgi:putative membrane protein
MNATTGKESLLRKLDIFAIAVSLVVLILVVLMRTVQLEVGIDFSMLPGFHAFLNSLVAVLLLGAFIAIKNKKINLHRNLVVTSMALSIVFLGSYVVYHITNPVTPYCMEGNIRFLYFLLLITHITLAALILPFILFTFNRAFTGFFDRHKRMAKWVFPIWFYVALTGPICYFMLKPCYG